MIVFIRAISYSLSVNEIYFSDVSCKYRDWNDNCLNKNNFDCSRDTALLEQLVVIQLIGKAGLLRSFTSRLWLAITSSSDSLKWFVVTKCLDPFLGPFGVVMTLMLPSPLQPRVIWLSWDPFDRPSRVPMTHSASLGGIFGVVGFCGSGTTVGCLED